MCDYSLEKLQSRPARKSETLVTHEFPRGSIGLAAPGNPDVAVCLSDGTVLSIVGVSRPSFVQRALDQISSSMRAEFFLKDYRALDEIHDGMEVVFFQKDIPKATDYRDSIRTETGVELTLQELGAGTSMAVIELPETMKSARALEEASV